MKNTSIFIPLLLIGCLAALIYLFFAALRAAEEDGGGGADRIVLNEEDYRSPGTADADDDETLDTRQEGANYEEYFEEVPEEEKVMPANEPTTKPTPAAPATAPPTTSTPTQTTPSTTTAAIRPAAEREGRYLVIAGTFSQAEGAKMRVQALRAAGFKDTRAESFNRGSYSVALAGQYDRYSSAKALATKIENRGFEVRVMKRR